MKTLAEFRTEIELGFYIYRNDVECYIHRDSFGYWFGGPGADNCYFSFEVLCREVQDIEKPIWTTLAPFADGYDVVDENGVSEELIDEFDAWCLDNGID